MRILSRITIWPAAARTAVAASLAVLLLLGLGLIAEANPLPQPVKDGQTVFQQKCSSCHTIGGGKTAGPDLKGVTANRDRAWLKNFIMAPDRLIAQKDPVALQLLQEYNNVPMPNMGVSDADASAVLDYIEAQSGAAPAAKPAQAQSTAQPAQPQAAAAATGDPASGQALFTGAKTFRNGGPPCISCHDTAGAGAMGGGVMGPDLTQTYNKYGGGAGIGPVLASLPFPPMKPLYDNRPLVPEEQADLKAFLQASAAQQPSQTALTLALLTILGLVILLAIAHLVWRRRTISVRRSLVGRG